MSKPKQVQDTKTTYTNWKPTETAYAQNIKNMPAQPEFLQPAQQAQYDRARERNASRLQSAYGQNVPESARMAMMQRGDRDLTADYGTALNQSAFDAQKANLQRQMYLDEAYRERPLQTGGTSTTQEKGGFWGGLLSGGLGLASRFI